MTEDFSMDKEEYTKCEHPGYFITESELDQYTACVKCGKVVSIIPKEFLP